MSRVEPISDITVYIVVIGVVALMMLGKYLMFSQKEENDKPKDN